MSEQDSKLQRHELLLLDIEGVDENWGPTFRSIYEAEEHEKFMDKLDARIKNHDKDIERMCNYHYQGFIESIRELLQLKTQVHKLNEELVNIDTELQNSSSQVISKARELVKARQVQRNIATAIENLTLCLPVLVAYSKLQKQMGEKRYYPALKTLEQLEQIHLPRIPNYRFSVQMRESIPVLREDIKQASMSDLKDFLENIRKFSEKIGEVAMRHTFEHMNGLSSGGEKRKEHGRQNPTLDVVDRKVIPESTYDVEEDLSAQDLIDFSPVYRCLHIYTALNSKETFEAYYRKQRTQQAQMVLQPPNNMHENINNYKCYIHAIVGFFVVEDHVLNTGGSLVNKIYLDEVWGQAISKIVNALRTNSSYCTDATLMLRIKDLLMLFSTTLRNYGYSVNPLFDLLHEMRDHYNEVLMQHWVGVFRKILDEETFVPIQVSNQTEYDAVTDSFPFKDDNATENFPRKLPFSQMVPKVYQEVKEYIYACLKFSEDLHLSQATINDMIRKSTTLLLTRTFSGSLLSLFRKPGLGLVQAVQILIDIGYLEEATVFLDEFICNITGTEKGEHSGTRRQAMFHVARDDAERQISGKLKEKVDEFLELENYDWALVEAQGHASNFITDLIVFLQSIFSSFTNMPSEVAQQLCKEACQHIAQSIMAFMLSVDVRQIAMGALHQINLDTIQCEQFAASRPVPGVSEDVLLRYFLPLRQLLDLFMDWDWSTYFHDFGKVDSKYEFVNPNTAIILLEKLNDNKTMFSVLKKSERDKKKLLDTVLKQLRQLAQAAQPE